MQEHPKAVGDRTTLAVMLVLESCGFRVYLPFSENTRCDLVLDDGVHLERVQCKSGRLRDGAPQPSASTHTFSRPYQVGHVLLSAQKPVAVL
jgi:hypothetical protein